MDVSSKYPLPSLLKQINLLKQTHFLIYSRANIAKKKLGLSAVCSLKCQAFFGIYDSFYSFSFLWTRK